MRYLIVLVLFFSSCAPKSAVTIRINVIEDGFEVLTNRTSEITIQEEFYLVGDHYLQLDSVYNFIPKKKEKENNL